MDTDEDGDDEAADAQAGAPLPSANGAVAATDPSAPVLLAASGPTYTMDVIEGEWDGFLEEPREPDTAARRTNAQPANEVAPAPQPTEGETMALNKRHRRQEKKRLAAEREAAIRQAVSLCHPWNNLAQFIGLAPACTRLVQQTPAFAALTSWWVTRRIDIPIVTSNPHHPSHGCNIIDALFVSCTMQESKRAYAATDSKSPICLI